MIVTPGFRRRALVVALTGIYGMGSQLVQANPTGAQVVNGQAVLQAQGNKLTVTNTPGAIINWQSFSIGAGETTYFQQQNAASAVLNRVQAQNPSLKSQIDGALGSNGRVFLINPNGIVFGAGSVIDTQGFVASTLNLNDADFKAGKLKFSSQAAAAGIEAKGRISSGSGDVYLVAPNIGVDGTAVITSEGGNIILAAGEAVEITGRNLNDITFTVQSKDNQAINLGTLSGGAVGVFAGTLSHSGVIQAQTLAHEGGRLVLKAQGNVTLDPGSKTLADGTTLGGSITITSQSGNVLLNGGSLVSAQAQPSANPLQAATRGGDVVVSAEVGVVAIEGNSKISVSAGRGGRVDIHADKLLQTGSIHADGKTTFGGNITLQADSRIMQTADAVVSAGGVLQGGDISMSVSADPAKSGYLFSSADIDASASSGVGGSITVSGRDLTFAAARLAANGDAGGGSLRIGGGKGGMDTSMPNSQNVVANAASSFEASARLDGDGGRVILWADGSNRSGSVLEARGGANGGNGGFIEVSGKEETQFGGMPNASAPHGIAGTFLLDPKFILIQAPAVVAGVSVELLDPNPGSNELFGSSLRLLGNGNIAVFNSQDDLFGTNSGAIYLYDGVTGALISNLHGDTANDRVGSGIFSGSNPTSPFVGFLGSGSTNMLISSPYWHNSTGALTVFNGTTGVAGSITSANSLVGSAAGDAIGSAGFGSLSGKYVAYSPNWNGAAGAITWIDSSVGLTGVVGAGNSLVGASPNDRVGDFGGQLVFLGNGKYYVRTSAYNASAGAITRIDSAAPTVGVVSSLNSLVGSASSDQIGSGGITTMSSGNYLIRSPNFGGGAGAITWASSAGAITGVIGAETNGNSIFGSAPSDGIGSGGVVFLDYSLGSCCSYGNFAVLSPNALGGASNGKGAVTLGTQSAGFVSSAVVSSNNSLVGSFAGDHVGSGGITRLPNGNFLIASPLFNTNTSGDSAGAVTWASGVSPISGTIDGTTVNGNSVYGNAPGDFVGNGGIQMVGGGINFVVVSPDASSVNSPGEAGVGAVSFGTQASGFAGPSGFGISVSNSLVGSTAGDHVGSGGVFVLNNGNYVVLSPDWNLNSTATLYGAVTWGSGATGVAGQVNTRPGLFGTQAGDRVGSGGITQLGNSGNYVIKSPSFNSDTNGNSAGAVTWADGYAAINGTIGSTANGNSIFGAFNDQIGSDGVWELGSGNFLVFSSHYRNTNAASVTNAGAVTWGDGASGFAQPGLVSSINSLVGTHQDDNVGLNPGSNLHDFGDYYLLRSPNWNSGLSAVTFSGSFGEILGNIASTNSLVGSFSGDNLGAGGILYLSTTGNYLILSPNYKTSIGNVSGAVTWGSSANTLFGTIGSETHGNSIFSNTPGDAIGSGGVRFLDYYSGSSYYGNFVVISPVAGNPDLAIANAGAVTFGDSATGFTNPGVVSSSNSLIGTHAGDNVGDGGIRVMYNPLDSSRSNYLVVSPDYNGGAGAVTWASGTAAIRGALGAEVNGNSIYGNVAADAVGSNGIQFLDYYSSSSYFGNFVVLSPDALGGAGAVTFGTQSSGFANAGGVSSNNSMVGANVTDHIGSFGIQRLYHPADYSLSNYLIFSPDYGGGAGAVTWANGTSAITGVIGAESGGNSIFGNGTGDAVGNNSVGDIAILGNYNFVVLSPDATNPAGSVAGAGAATFGNESSGFASPGAISAANSLVGDHLNDHVGSLGIQTLSNNLFAVLSPEWNGNMGAISWGSQISGISGVVGAGNSLVGSTAGTPSTGDRVGSSGLNGFSSGYYVRSAQWSSGAGAISFIDTSSPTVGAITAANSLVGTTAGDSIGSLSITNLGNNKIAVFSPNWDNGAVLNAGAVTWLDATAPFSGFTGTVSAGNSLVGSSANDQVGSGFYTSVAGSSNLLAIRSGSWDNGGVSNAGALTWFNTTGLMPTGAVSVANSLVGSNTNDGVGSSSQFYGGVSNGVGYTVVTNTQWNGGRGAATWMAAGAPLTGAISAANSLVGSNVNDFVGNGGVRTSSNNSNSFLNGDYIVVSPSFNSSSGALTVGAGGSGISGVVSGANSLVGFGTSYTMVNNRTRMLVASGTADNMGFTNNGQICLYAGGAGCATGLLLSLPQSYSTNPGTSITITPAQITAILSNGTQVQLQANTDITLDVMSDLIANNSSGNGGALTLSAGRSVLLNSSIVTDNGNLTIIANDLAGSSSGVSAADRDPGTAEITMADGTRLDAGIGVVSIQLRSGAGHAGAGDTASNINLRSITAASLSVKTDFGGIKIGDPDAQAASDINIAGNVELISPTKILLAGGRRGAYAQVAAGGKVTVGLPDDPSHPGVIKPVLELRNGGSFARILSTSLTENPAIDLQISDCITCLRLSSGEFIGSGTGLLDAITASLLSLNPNLLDQIEDTKKSKGDIEIEGGETCK